MTRILTRLFVALHRWLGIVMCLFFAMWFFSGIVMIYVPFPSLSDSDRLAFLETVDSQSIEVTPSEAISVCGISKVDRLRVISFSRRPIFVCHAEISRLRSVFADVQSIVEPMSLAQVRDLAQDLSIDVSDISGPIEFDQWIVHQKFDAYRPFYKIKIADEQGTHLYLSSKTGEILQRTTAHNRLWNYVGAVAHWIYPTVLRKHWALWDKTVWWLSLIGIFTVSLGIYLGISQLVKVRKTGRHSLSPFKGWMRWHHIMGLFSGFFVLSWIFSGWLSMDHGRLFSLSKPTEAQITTAQGLTMQQVAARFSGKKLRSYDDAREIEFHAFGGAELILASNQDGRLDGEILLPSTIAEVISAAWKDAPTKQYSVVPHKDTYTHLREGQLPTGTIRVELDDSASTWVHVDQHSGEIISVVDRSRRMYRWLFNGLHSLDVPGLVDKRPIWDVIMLVLLVSGFAGSITSVVVGAKRLIKR